jgi:hypothetical protein
MLRRRRIRARFPARQRRWQRKKPLTEPHDPTIVRPQTNNDAFPRMLGMRGRLSGPVRESTSNNNHQPGEASGFIKEVTNGGSGWH